MMRFLDQMLCGLLGRHNYEQRFGMRQITWVCSRCLKQKAGLRITGKGPRQRFAGDPDRHRMTRLGRIE